MFIPPPSPTGLYIQPKLQQQRSEAYDRARREINWRGSQWDWRVVPDCEVTRLVRRGLAGYRLTDAEVEMVKAWKP